VRTVAAPPNAKRMTYSYQRPSRSDDVESRIGVMSAPRPGSAARRRRQAIRRTTAT
jgi:hypothetical protein